MCSTTEIKNTKYPICEKVKKVLKDEEFLGEELVNKLERKSSNLQDFLSNAGHLYFSFGKSWDNVVKALKVKEEEEDEATKLVREAFRQQIDCKDIKSLPFCKGMSTELNKFVSDLSMKCDNSKKRGRQHDDYSEYKAKKIQKSVSFSNLLLKVEDIPPKEETWPYGSLYGEVEPVAHSEYEKLYNYDSFASDEEEVDDLELSSDDSETDICNKGPLKEITSTAATILQGPKLENFITKSLGKAFLLKNGQIVKIVSVIPTKKMMWGKIFRRFADIHAQLSHVQKQYHVRAGDYIETDSYTSVGHESIISECVIENICNQHISTSGRNKQLLKKNSSLKQFRFFWYFSSHENKLYPYPFQKIVSVLWPADGIYYNARVDTSDINEKGHVLINYVEDDSFEYVDLLKMIEEENIKANV